MKKQSKILLVIALALVVVLAFAGCGNNDNAWRYVDAEWANENLNDLVVIDARAAESYQAGHIDGAVNLEWSAVSEVACGENVDGWGSLLDAKTLGGILGGLGIDGKKDVLVYIDPVNGWGEDGRLFWTLDQAGIDNAYILDGGISAWTAAGYTVTTETTVVEAVDCTINSEYTEEVDTAYVAENLDKVVMLDVRSDEEYNGETNMGEVGKGHIPGAIHAYYMDFIHEDGTVLTAEEITKVMDGLGISTDDEVITYCTGGVRAAFVGELLKMSGYNAKVYSTSFAGWTAAGNEVE